MAYDWQHIFGDIGELVQAANIAKQCSSDLLDQMSELAAELDDDEEDLTFLDDALAGVQSAAKSATSAETTIARLVRTYITNRLPEKLESSYSGVDAVLDDMVAKMEAESQSVDANHPTVTPPYTEAGDNNNQLSGWENIRGMSSDNAELVGRDWVLYASIIDDGGGSYHVEVYNDSARGAGDLIAHTASYNSTGEQALIEDNASDISGSITIDAVVGADADITVTYDFDGPTALTGKGYPSAWNATEMAIEDDIRIKCTSISGGAGAETWEVVSRRRGAGASATTGVAYPGTNDDTLGIEFTITAGAADFAVGDEFILSTNVTESGTFQTFFRRHFGRLLPSNDEGGETIDDALAE